MSSSERGYLLNLSADHLYNSSSDRSHPAITGASLFLNSLRVIILFPPAVSDCFQKAKQIPYDQGYYKYSYEQAADHDISGSVHEISTGDFPGDQNMIFLIITNNAIR